MEEEMMNRSNCDDQATASVHLLPPSILLPTPTQPEKKKKSLPGNPDPEIEVRALSPKSLLSANMFTCEICNKGFQREQNLQLHRRGHNLPWKLKQKSSKEDHEGEEEEEEEGMVKVKKKKVYVCPEVTCVHHNPASALRDLAGIKKHFSKKHGEKKWKCDKCFKRYSVQSDLKAHSKTCGIKEYTCECGTIFSRKESFITHRAFCDTLVEESARIVSLNPLLLVPPFHHYGIMDTTNNKNHIQNYQTSPNWLLPNPNPIPFPPPPSSPHMSAVALLQKAAQSATINTSGSSSGSCSGSPQAPLPVLNLRIRKR